MQLSSSPNASQTADLSFRKEAGTLRARPHLKAQALKHGRSPFYRIPTQALEFCDNAFKVLVVSTAFWLQPKAVAAGVFCSAASSFIKIHNTKLKKAVELVGFCLHPKPATSEPLARTQTLTSRLKNAALFENSLRAYRTASLCRTAVALALNISSPSNPMIPFAIGWLALRKI